MRIWTNKPQAIEITGVGIGEVLVMTGQGEGLTKDGRTKISSREVFLPNIANDVKSFIFMGQRALLCRGQMTIGQQKASLLPEEHGIWRARRGEGAKWLMDREIFLEEASHWGAGFGPWLVGPGQRH